MKYVSFEVLIQALQEQGIDDTYNVLEQLFLEDYIAVVDHEGDVIRTFFEPDEVFDYLEYLQTQVDMEE